MKFINNCRIAQKRILRKIDPKTYAKRCARETFSAWGGDGEI